MTHYEMTRRRMLQTSATAALGLTALGAGWGSAASAATSPYTKGAMLTSTLLKTSDFTIAHHGGNDNWAQESAYAYAQCASSTYNMNAFEISLGRSTDGVWYGVHDQYLNTVIDTAGTSYSNTGTDLPASGLPWSTINSFKILATSGNTGGDQPFFKLTDFLTTYCGTRTIFLDPKFVTYSARLAAELNGILTWALANVTTSSTKLVDHFVLKGPGGYTNSVQWATAARNAGMYTWGYFYAGDQARLPVAAPTGTLTEIETYAKQSYWTWLGLDVPGSSHSGTGGFRTQDGSTSPQLWSAVKSIYAKPVIAHVISGLQPKDTATTNPMTFPAGTTDAALAISYGANGLMISSPKAVLS